MNLLDQTTFLELILWSLLHNFKDYVAGDGQDIIGLESDEVVLTQDDLSQAAVQIALNAVEFQSIWPQVLHRNVPHGLVVEHVLLGQLPFDVLERLKVNLLDRILI